MYYHTYYKKSPVRFIAIPYWIAESLATKGLPVEAVMNFKIIRGIFSVETLAQLASVQGVIAKTTNLTDSEQLFTEWGKGATQAQLAELDSVIRPLSGNVDALQEVTYRLSEECSSDYAKDYFELSSSGRDLCIAIVKKGFLNYFAKSSDNQLAFMRDCVEQLYVHTPREQVRGSHIYRLYVGMLSMTLTSAVFE